MCAGADEGGVDACTGDSGGPLVCEYNGQWHLEGLTSHGDGWAQCGAKGTYGFYANIRHFHSWIEEILRTEWSQDAERGHSLTSMTPHLLKQKRNELIKLKEIHQNLPKMLSLKFFRHALYPSGNSVIHNEFFHSQEQSISSFACGLTRNITSHSMKNLASHSILRWEMIILPILTTSLTHFLFERLGECAFWNWEWKVTARVWNTSRFGVHWTCHF